VPNIAFANKGVPLATASKIRSLAINAKCMCAPSPRNIA
jgi:hypothetical protein